MLGLSVTETRTRSLAHAGCLEKGHGQRRVSALGWAPRASFSVTGGSQAGGRGWAARRGLLQHCDPHPLAWQLRPPSLVKAVTEGVILL